MLRAAGLVLVALCSVAGADDAVVDAPRVSTRLRGEISPADARHEQTLSRLGVPLTEAGVGGALDGKNPTAQLAAVVAVSTHRWRKLAPRVAHQLDGPAALAIEAAATLVEIGDRAERGKGSERLRRALEDPTGDVRLNAATYLARAGDGTGIPELRRELGSTEEAFRIQAVNSLAAFVAFDGRVVDGKRFDLMALLDGAARDPSVLVRRAACYRLVALPRSPARDALLRRLAGDPDRTVQQAAGPPPS